MSREGNQDLGPSETPAPKIARRSAARYVHLAISSALVLLILYCIWRLLNSLHDIAPTGL
jgi:hypothetical protein